MFLSRLVIVLFLPLNVYEFMKGIALDLLE